MNERDRATLLEAAITPHRERDPEGRIVPSLAWSDLSPADRDLLFRLQLASRVLEEAASPAGRSGTAEAVMNAITEAG